MVRVAVIQRPPVFLERAETLKCLQVDTRPQRPLHRSTEQT